MTSSQDDLDAATRRLAAAEEKLNGLAGAPDDDDEKRAAHDEWTSANAEVERLKAEFEHRD